MPCPPLPEELESQSARREIAMARSNAHTLDRVKLLITALQGAHPQACTEESGLVDVAALDANLNLSPEPDWWNNSNEVDDFWVWSQVVRNEAKRLENDLCVASTVLVCLWGTLDGEDTTAYLEEYQSLEALHRLHRESDRQRVVYNLDYKLQSEEVDAAEQRRLNALRDEILARDIETLMRNRDALADAM